MLSFSNNNNNSFYNNNNNNNNKNNSNLKGRSESAIKADCNSILRRYFKYDSFRSNQLEIILNTILGNDSLVVMATGSGKSLCYQIPPIYLNKTAIIISPLISLVKNQVDALLSRNIKAISFTGSSKATYDDIDDAFNGKYQIIYLTPEGIDSRLFKLKQLHNNYGISCIAIDESHCVSSWGHDFRPAYTKLFKLRQNLPQVPILALTATATPKVQQEIKKILQLKHNCLNVVSTFNRTNLSYFVHPKNSVANDLTTISKRKQYYTDGSTIIYCKTRGKCNEIANLLCASNLNATPYHAGLNQRRRTEIQRKWELNQYQCIVATIAFGMGIDKPDIRYVIHYGMPSSIEGYYQQTGRAGRDGKPAKCILYYADGDLSSTYHLGNSITETGKNLMMQKNKDMKEFVYTNNCRIGFILNYFHESFDACGCKTRCDNCIQRYKSNNNNNNNNFKEQDFTQQSRHLVQACLDTGERYGMVVLCEICKGIENVKTKKLKYIKNKKSWNTLNNYSLKWIRALFRKLLVLNVLNEVATNTNNVRFRTYKRIVVTAKGRRLLFNGDCLKPWIPDKDMIIAAKLNRTKAKASKSMFSFAGNRKRSYSDLNHNSNNNKSPFPKRVKRSSLSSSQSSVNTKKASTQWIYQNENVNSSNSPAADNANNNKTSNTSLGSIASIGSMNLNSFQCNNKEKVKPTKSLKDFLIAMRKKLAKRNGVIQYQIINNNGIDVINRYKPSNIDKLKLISNKYDNNNDITSLFLTKYSQIFLKVIQKYCKKYSIKTDQFQSDNDNIDKDNIQNKDNNDDNDIEMNYKIEEVCKKKINCKIAALPPHTKCIEFDLPLITTQSQQIYKSFISGKSIENIIKSRQCRRKIVEQCLSDMIVNGYNIDWSRLRFTIKQIKVCFDALSTVGYDAGYQMLRNYNKQLLNNLTDSEFDLLIARYLVDNFKNDTGKYQQFPQEEKIDVNQKQKNTLNNNVNIEYKTVKELLSKSSNGLNIDEICKQLNLTTDDQKIKLLKLLQEMAAGFDVYRKHDKYFLF